MKSKVRSLKINKIDKPLDRIIKEKKGKGSNKKLELKKEKLELTPQKCKGS